MHTLLVAHLPPLLTINPNTPLLLLISHRHQPPPTTTNYQPTGILIEDQVWPKSCGHVKGKRVTGREEAVSRIRAAADARWVGSDH